MSAAPAAFAALFAPYTLRSVTIPNRVWMAPMCQYSAEAFGPNAGVAGDWHFAHYAARATGGTGLIVQEATAVSPEGRISPYDLGIWNDTQVDALRRITAFVKSQGAVPGIQIAHAGRKASTDRTWKGGRPVGAEAHGWQPVAPSPVPFSEGYPVPHELTVEEIREITGQFAAAAERSLAAGYEVVEIHGAHGYLIGEFLSPYSNKRTDAYGGSFENRTRFALEVVDAVRAVWPEELPSSSGSPPPTGWRRRAGPPTRRSAWPTCCWNTAWTCSTSRPAASPRTPRSPWAPATRSPSRPGSRPAPTCPWPPSA